MKRLETRSTVYAFTILLFVLGISLYEVYGIFSKLEENPLFRPLGLDEIYKNYEN